MSAAVDIITALLVALMCCCLLFCVHRLAELSHRIDMVVIVQQSLQLKLDELENDR